MTPHQELIIRRRETKRLRKRFTNSPQAAINREVWHRIRALAQFDTPEMRAQLEEILHAQATP